MAKLNKKLAIKSYQKQHGLHHKIDKKYGKVYWPYLPILLVTILGMSLGLLISTQNQNSKSNTVSYASLLTTTNQLRIKNGLSQLNYNKTLSTAAQIQANQIAIASSWSPLSTSQKPAFNLVTNDTSLSSPKENLAFGFKSSSSVVSAWSNSNYQDSNMLSSESNSVGFGIVSAPSFLNMRNQKIIVAIFANNNTLPTVAASAPSSYNLSSNVQSLAVIRLNSIIKYKDTDELYILAALMIVLASVVLSKHAYMVHKWIHKGEKLVVKHPLLDLTLVAAFIILAVAIQATGYIS